MDQTLAKYEELYALSKEAVAGEIERMRRVDEKASKFASLSGLLVTLSALAGKFILVSFIPPKTLSGWVCLISYLLFFATMLFAFIDILRSMRIVTINVSPMNDEMISFFNKEEYIDILYALARGNSEIIKRNAAECQKKLNSLLQSYRALLLSVLFAFAFVTSLIIWTFQKA